jgi:hypothetical protein
MFMYVDLERSGEEAANSRYYPSNGMENHWRSFQISQYSDRYLKRAPPKYKSHVLELN